MYLIIEKAQRTLYAYVETAKMFKTMARYREDLQELPQTVLNEECDLSDLQDNSYIVFKIEKEKRPKKKAKRAK